MLRCLVILILITCTLSKPISERDIISYVRSNQAKCFNWKAVPFRVGDQTPNMTSVVISRFIKAMVALRPKKPIYKSIVPGHGHNFTCGDALRQQKAFFPKVLISDRMWDRVLAIADRIPGRLTRSMVLEARMDADGVDVDPSFQLQRSVGEDIELAIGGPRGETVWSRVHDFGTHWANKHSPIHALVYDMWFEIDVAHAFKSSSSLPVPSMFIGTDDGLRGSLQSTGLYTFADWAGYSMENVFRSMEDVIATTPPPLTTPFHPTVLRGIMGSIFTLPWGMNIYQVGLWFARETQMSGVRLVIEVEEGAGRDRGVHWSTIVCDYLMDIGWKGNGEALSKYLKETEEHVDYMFVAVDVGAKTGPRIGLETYVSDENDWIPILKKLEEKGLATMSKARSLIKFIEGSKGKARYSKAVLGGQLYIQSRRLNHIKLVFEHDTVTSFKVYMYSGYFLPNELSASARAAANVALPTDNILFDSDSSGADDEYSEGDSSLEDSDY